MVLMDDKQLKEHNAIICKCLDSIGTDIVSFQVAMLERLKTLQMQVCDLSGKEEHGPAVLLEQSTGYPKMTQGVESQEDQAVNWSERSSASAEESTPDAEDNAEDLEGVISDDRFPHPEPTEDTSDMDD